MAEPIREDQGSFMGFFAIMLIVLGLVGFLMGLGYVMGLLGIQI